MTPRNIGVLFPSEKTQKTLQSGKNERFSNQISVHKIKKYSFLRNEIFLTKKKMER